MNRWPDFFIVGTMRAGTTSLYEYLSSHPDVLMPPTKETYYFSSIYTQEPRAAKRSLILKIVDKKEDYLKLFEGARPDQVIGEASPGYLADLNSAQRILEVAPHAKIIMLLREPVERCYSHYLLETRSERDPKPFYEAVLEDYDRLQRFGGGHSIYVWPGLYYEQVKKYLDVFDRHQVLVHLYEDLATDTFGLVRNDCDFLGLPFYDGRFFDSSRKYNTTVEPRNPISREILTSQRIQSLAYALVPKPLLVGIRNRLMSSERPKPPLDPRAHEFLRSIYHDDINKLKELINRDLSGWLA